MNQQVYRENEEYRNHMMQQAENWRLAKQAAPYKSGNTHRPLLAGLGKQLVALGQRLQEQSEHEKVEVGQYLRPQW